LSRIYEEVCTAVTVTVRTGTLIRRRAEGVTPRAASGALAVISSMTSGTG